MSRRIVLMMAMLALILPQMVSGQPPEERHRLRERRRDDLEERIHTMKIWKLTDELQLSEEQAARFFPLMTEHDRKQDEMEKKRRDLLEKLGDIVWDSNPDAKAIDQILNDLEDSGEQQAKLRQQFRKDVSGILRPDQIGKLVLFNIRFPEIVRGMVREREEENAPPPPPRRWRD